MTNRVILRGFVADDPLIRATESGRFARLRMATIEQLTNTKTGRTREHTEWHTVSMFGENAVIADQEIHRGTPIEIEGALRTREWADKAGVVRKTTEISVSKLTILETIEGCRMPPSIADSIPTARPTSITPIDSYEIKAPANDPDDLPF